MSEIRKTVENVSVSSSRQKNEIVAEISESLKEAGFTIAEQDASRPWGAFVRLGNKDGDRFVESFFNGLNPADARLGNSDAELSPKILVVSPEQRLSWQYHDRRAERWMFVNDGAYYKSLTDEQGEINLAEAGDVVQFETGERHRLVGALGHYTFVAEIWQHTDAEQLSDEDDIVRLQDDYKR